MERVVIVGPFGWPANWFHLWKEGFQWSLWSVGTGLGWSLLSIFSRVQWEKKLWTIRCFPRCSPRVRTMSDSLVTCLPLPQSKEKWEAMRHSFASSPFWKVRLQHQTSSIHFTKASWFLFFQFLFFPSFLLKYQNKGPAWPWLFDTFSLAWPRRWRGQDGLENCSLLSTAYTMERFVIVGPFGWPATSLDINPQALIPAGINTARH